jgi:sialate O-acetylesterase
MSLSFSKNNRLFIKCSVLLICFAATSAIQAAIELPRLISPCAIMQRDQALPIWGKAKVNVDVTVSLGTVQQITKSDAAGNWRVEFDAQQAGGPHSIKIEAGTEQRLLTGIYFGDIWVASGQSNMEWVLRNSEKAEKEINGTEYPQIKHFKVPLTFASEPQDTLADGNWLPAIRDHKPDFSAVGYFFAKKIHLETGVPIGIIGSNWGGSSIEAWMSSGILKKPQAETAGFINNMESDSQRKTTALKKALQRWPGVIDKNYSNAKAYWQNENVDTSDWLTLNAPQLWEQQGYSGMDGVVWYRKTFELSQEQSSGVAKLSLARIDDNDVTYVNGEKVGETHAYDVARSYAIPEGILKSGLNTIAIRIEDTGGGGGIYSSEDMLFVELADKSKLSLVGEWQFKADKVSVSFVAQMNQVETALYNKMMYPLFQFPVKGVIWYQGESNAVYAQQAENYAAQFKSLILDWRQRWGQSSMPFYWVQLANFNSGTNTETEKPWAILRESQTGALELNNTGQAITIDVGNPSDIHPRDKQTVGNRLAAIALNRDYGLEHIRFKGPVFNSATYSKSKVQVKFDALAALKLADGNAKLMGFELAAADGKFKAVEGKLKANATIELNWTEEEKPFAIRYAWDDNPEGANLADESGLPAEPFRGKVN